MDFKLALLKIVDLSAVLGGDRFTHETAIWPTTVLDFPVMAKRQQKNIGPACRLGKEPTALSHDRAP